MSCRLIDDHGRPHIIGAGDDPYRHARGQCRCYPPEVRLVRLRWFHLPLMWYWRNYTVPARALQHPRTSWLDLIRWYRSIHQLSYVSSMIKADGQLVGYCFIRCNYDTGIFIGSEINRLRGIGTAAMRLLMAEARARGLTRLTCGTDIPEWAKRFGFNARSGWVSDHGVMRLPMEVFL